MGKTGRKRCRRMIVSILILAMVLGLMTMTASAEGKTDSGTYYGVEFSYNGKVYETLDVKEIPVSNIAEALGLEGEIQSVTASNRFHYYSAEERDGQWYIHTTAETSYVAGAPYTGNLFDGEESVYYDSSHNIVIRTGGVNHTVTLKYIAVPIHLNNPGAVDGVTVGDTIYTFASGMPLSTVYIDNDNFQIPTSYEILTDEPGFVRLNSTDAYFPGFVVYDPSRSGARKLKAGQENYFEGPLFSFTFENAAILSDGSVANVRITYSDAYITVDDRATGGFPYMVGLADGKRSKIAPNDTRTGSVTIDGESYFKAYSAACRMNEAIQIVDDNGVPIEGTFIAGVEGVNVDHAGLKVTKPLYNGYLYDFWSESVQVNGGTASDIYVRPNDSSIEPDTGDGTPEYQRKWYYSLAKKNDQGIKFTGVRWAVSNGSDIIPQQGHDHYYSAGFVTTADAYDGIQFTTYNAGSYPTGYANIYFLNGYSIWHRIRSSSTKGGTIETTTEGNPDGSLPEGSTVLDPGTYVVPDGKTVVYTMTPKDGFELDKVIVKSKSLSYSGGEDVTDEVEANAVYDESGNVLYYTYTFPANTVEPQSNHDNQAIHVKWKRATEADLTVKKTAIDGDAAFTFHVKVNGRKWESDAWKEVSSWETNWRSNYSFAHISAVSYPLVLDGVTYDDDVEQMSLTDDLAKLILNGNFGSEPVYEKDDLKLYEVTDSGGQPYTIEIEGQEYSLYSDTKDWATSGAEGSNKANFWIHDTANKVENYYDISVVSEEWTPETIDLSKDPYNGTAVSGKEGVYAFTITTTDGEGSLKLPDLPYGYDYTVEEQPDKKWELTDSKDTSGTLEGNCAAKFTNTRIPTGDLTVTKTVEGEGGDKNKEFDFTVTLSDTSINGTYGDMTFEDGVATFSLKDGGSLTAVDLPAEVEYEVKEAGYLQDGYETTKTGDTGEIVDNDEVTAAFTNTRIPTGDLTVTKTVEGKGGDKNKEFDFTVTLSDTSINGTYGDMTFEGGVATFSLKDGESKTATNLPEGVEYEVTEADYTEDLYETTKTGDTGAIVVDEEVTAAFTNTRHPIGDLTVTKTVEGEGGDKTKEFDFTVTLSDTSINGAYGDMTFTDGVATFSLKDGDSLTAEGLPDAMGYEVTEADYTEDGYAITKTGDTGEIAGDEAVTAAFTNTLIPPGSLIVTKTVEGEGGDRTKAFDFTVTLSDDSINGTYGELTFTDGVAEFSLKDGESLTAEGLPDGMGYEVTEADYTEDGYETTMEGNTGEIVSDEVVTAEFTNTRTPEPTSGPTEPPTTEPTTTEEPTTTTKSPVTTSEEPTTTTAAPPYDPTEPSGSDEPTGKKDVSTGDSSHIALWLALIAAFLVGVMVIAVHRRRRPDRD